MMSKKCLFVVFIFTFLSCKKETDYRFAKVWFDTEYVIPGNTTLKINSDYTFDYESRGCQWRTFSRGNWKVVQDTIELNSTPIDTCHNVHLFAECIYFGEYLNKKNPITIKDCTVESASDYTAFRKHKFYLRNDSLVYKQKPSSNCLDSMSVIFAKTEKVIKND